MHSKPVAVINKLTIAYKDVRKMQKQQFRMIKIYSSPGVTMILSFSGNEPIQFKDY